MKTLILLLLLSSFFCKGQDSIPNIGLGSGTTTVLRMSKAVNGSPERKKDTTNVIMLVCDTNTMGSTSMGFIHPLDQALNDRRIIYWVKGFSVRELHNTSEGVMDAGMVQCLDETGHLKSCYSDYWQHIYFLDEHKKSISKDIIVWQSTEIK